MAYIIELPTFTDERGKLTVIEKVLPFEMKRVYFIYDIKDKRGGHKHKKTKQALMCINGKCNVLINNNQEEKSITLNSPNKCLILEPQDWHIIEPLEEQTIILVIASEYYSRDDYIYEK